MHEDLLSLAGLRPDGRRKDEIRRLRCRFGVLASADGSAYIEMGQTKVVAIVKGPHEVNKRQDAAHGAIIKCEFNHAPFSGSERKKRRKSDRKSVEMALSVKDVFEGAIMAHLYPRTQIDIYIHVIQTDGGTLPACINATSLAVMDAGIAMKDMVVSCSAGYVDGCSIMDLNYVEQSFSGPQMPVAILPSGEELLLARMEARLPVDIFEDVLRCAMRACQQVHAVLRHRLREHATAALRGQTG